MSDDIDPVVAMARIVAGAEQALERGRTPEVAYLGTEAYAAVMRWMAFWGKVPYDFQPPGWPRIFTSAGPIRLETRETLWMAAVVQDTTGEPYPVTFHVE